MYEVIISHLTCYYETLEEVAWNNMYHLLNINTEIRVIDCFDRQPIDVEIVRNLARKRYYDNVNRRLAERRKQYKFRDTPVPGTGRKWRYHGERKPKTKQERSQEVPTRAKRNSTNLPTSWDDIYSENQRSWKKFRKTQWKEK